MSDRHAMISFDRGTECFNFRVAGIAIDCDRVLLHTTKRDDFWSFPGGRVEMGENSADSLIREMKEELDADVEVIRLLWLVENFFVYNQKNYHEICFYYLMEFTERSPYLDKDTSFRGVEIDLNLQFNWFPVDSDILAQLPLLPIFLQRSLRDLPTSVEHVVWSD
ncbi:MAG: NUDIX hydrolase [Cyanobacteria bacterium J06600_6]